MAIPSLPEPPRTAIVDKEGMLTLQGRRWFDLLYKKLGQAGKIPTESVDPSVSINSSNDAVVDWVDVDASTGKLRVYGPGGVGTTWNRYEGTKVGFLTRGPLAAIEFTGKAYNVFYFVTYDPATATYSVTTDFRDTLKDGLYWVGSALASVSQGGGGSTSGGGGTSDSGTGGIGDYIPGFKLSGFGRMA
jgi:hypothetical protein